MIDHHSSARYPSTLSAATLALPLSAQRCSVGMRSGHWPSCMSTAPSFAITTAADDHTSRLGSCRATTTASLTTALDSAGKLKYRCRRSMSSPPVRFVAKVFLRQSPASWRTNTWFP